jgi:hypothetical protein
MQAIRNGTGRWALSPTRAFDRLPSQIDGGWIDLLEVGISDLLVAP